MESRQLSHLDERREFSATSCECVLNFMIFSYARRRRRRRYDDDLMAYDVGAREDCWTSQYYRYVCERIITLFKMVKLVRKATFSKAIKAQGTTVVAASVSGSGAYFTIGTGVFHGELSDWGLCHICLWLRDPRVTKKITNRDVMPPLTRAKILKTALW